MSFYSPVQQDFVWCAEYADGTDYWEFDPHTKAENAFIGIRRKDLIRFGLIGQGAKMYFEVYGGYFKIAGHLIELSFVQNDQVYPLTGLSVMYHHILTFKHAVADLISYNRTKPSIQEYMFGYEQEVMIDGLPVTLRVLCHVPFKQPLYFSFELKTSEPIKGKLRVHKNRTTDEFDAELEANEQGVLNWTFTM